MISNTLLLLSLYFCLTRSLSLFSTGGGSYGPTSSSCPANRIGTRLANSLSQEEADWVNKRNKITDQNLIDFLKHANMQDFDPESYIKSLDRSIKIGLAFSGGGYRAMLCGAGQFAALDKRTQGAWENGLGGLVQSSTYTVGLSGGSWLVGTIALNEFTDVDQIIRENKLWNLAKPVFMPGGLNILETLSVLTKVELDVLQKWTSGFGVSITDVWGRVLSYQFFNKLKDFGAGLTWSSITNTNAFANHNMPFPIVIALGREPGTYIISTNSTVIEFNPYEMGSWDPTLYQFTPLQYLGTEYNNGRPRGTCVTGFDNAGFIVGTSSSVFNLVFLKILQTLPWPVSTILAKISDLLDRKDDIAIYSPNPFRNTRAAAKKISGSDTLYLVDGGEDSQNIPFAPLLQPERDVDVIFAYDNSADDSNSWPNGAAIRATFQRQFNKQGLNASMFPYVPDASTFENLKLNSKPMFFGCNAKDLIKLQVTTKNPFSIYSSPLIVYTANRKFSYSSNTPTFQLIYLNSDRNMMIQNGFEVASRLNSTLDSEWQACVGCAIIRREQERQGQEQTEQCKRCFKKYCWNGPSV
ncbi:phospholipase B [Spathaspora passalidarum NRRL Y-27907]|uniref:Lysophospholipase n=1 Tax=Spathaspora passalidarum (strain NRRL Y-27907 / 11-Y1) TaxID=619300 RepID=G3AIW9_SPAPN|nr:phospholipase B [Spathaspora passalidarum NRRL Y-27907]EGW33780.1 phospholipase B [Spathaspora passalidarum NRRL Y-27907]